MKDTDFPSEIVGMTDIVARDIDDAFIKSRIYTVRSVQVIIDRDLASLYGVEAKYLNRQVKRNIERFPEDFMFQLTKEECLRCQIVTLNEGQGQHLKYMPYAFTENGIAMLSGVLRSHTAIEINIKIMRVFNAMRRALASMAPILERIAETERRQLEDRAKQIADQSRNEERFDTIFKAMDGGDFPPQKVFFDGKHYDAYSFAKKLVRKAAKKIVLVDGYSDEVTLDILSQKKTEAGRASLAARSRITHILSCPKGFVPRKSKTMAFFFALIEALTALFWVKASTCWSVNVQQPFTFSPARKPWAM